MPIINGKETLNELRKCNPNIKVILISGYGEVQKIKDIFNYGALRFIEKLFNLFELSKVINKI